jgi:PGF-pre-PGF domain-containing protein
MKGNYSSSTADIMIEGNTSAIIFGNASVLGLDASINLTEGSTTVNGSSVGYVGMPSENFDELAGKLSPKTCVLRVPKGADGTCDSIWKCDENVDNCYDVTANATLLDDADAYCEWKIPCDFSLYRAGLPGAPGGTTGTTGGVGGAGAAGGVAEITKITVVTAKGNATIKVPSVISGKSANVVINKTEDMAVSEINVTVKNTVVNMQIIIKKLDAKPVSITKELAGKVYHYINVDKANVTDADFTKVKIKFKVEKSWINANGINVSTIALSRYEASGLWNTLVTKKYNETSDDLYFEAESPGLSVFAVSGETNVGFVPATTTTVPTTTTTSATTTTTAAPPVKISYNLLLGVGVVAVLASSIIFIFWQRSNAGKKKEEE